MWDEQIILAEGNSCQLLFIVVNGDIGRNRIFNDNLSAIFRYMILSCFIELIDATGNMPGAMLTWLFSVIHFAVVLPTVCHFKLL